jgi:hypothetical protein
MLPFAKRGTAQYDRTVHGSSYGPTTHGSCGQCSLHRRIVRRSSGAGRRVTRYDTSSGGYVVRDLSFGASKSKGKAPLRLMTRAVSILNVLQRLPHSRTPPSKHSWLAGTKGFIEWLSQLQHATPAAIAARLPFACSPTLRVLGGDDAKAESPIAAPSSFGPSQSKYLALWLLTRSTQP